MNPERWKQIETIYDAALKLDAERRSSFLDRACNGDLELRVPAVNPREKRKYLSPSLGVRLGPWQRFLPMLCRA